MWESHFFMSLVLGGFHGICLFIFFLLIHSAGQNFHCNLNVGVLITFQNSHGTFSVMHLFTLMLLIFLSNLGSYFCIGVNTSVLLVTVFCCCVELLMMLLRHAVVQAWPSLARFLLQLGLWCSMPRIVPNPFAVMYVIQHFLSEGHLGTITDVLDLLHQLWKWNESYFCGVQVFEGEKKSNWNLFVCVCVCVCVCQDGVNDVWIIENEKSTEKGCLRKYGYIFSFWVT